MTVEDAPKGEGKAIAALVLGSSSLVLAAIPILGLPAGIAGLVLGLRSLKSRNQGLAVAGAVTGGMGIFASLVIAVLGIMAVVRVAGLVNTALNAKVRVDLMSIHRCAEYLLARTGGYPANLDDILHPRDADGRPIDPLLDEEPVDPWGRRYIYRLEDGKPVVECLGKDGLPGGRGEDADFRYP